MSIGPARWQLHCARRVVEDVSRFRATYDDHSLIIVMVAEQLSSNKQKNGSFNWKVV